MRSISDIHNAYAAAIQNEAVAWQLQHAEPTPQHLAGWMEACRCTAATRLAVIDEMRRANPSLWDSTTGVH